MSLHNRLKKVKSIGEEKKITLRVPENKGKVLEILAKYYDTNVSTIIREMIDEAIMKLQKDLIVLPDELGVKTIVDNQEILITYFPDVVALLTNDSYPYTFSLKDCNCDGAILDASVKEDARLSVEKGIALSYTGITPISKEEYHFTKQGDK